MGASIDPETGVFRWAPAEGQGPWTYHLTVEVSDPGLPAAKKSDAVSVAISVFEDAAMDAGLDSRRGFDHGLFVPLKLLYPDADIPCIQLSLVKNLDPALHIEMGRMLSPLAERNILVVGSGMSFHNMQAFFTPETDEIRQQNHAFEDWLEQTCADPAVSAADRELRLTGWEQAPAARFNHPREEHLLPLHVCCGMAGCRAADRSWSLFVLGKRVSAYLWGEGV